MKVEEAIERIKYRIETASLIAVKGVDGKAFEDLDMAIEALEKQLPKKVAFKRNAYGGISVCPICGASDYGKYCRQCGQKIDWGE